MKWQRYALDCNVCYPSLWLKVNQLKKESLMCTPFPPCSQHVVDVTSHVWNWLKSVNNQPDFIVPSEDVLENNQTT